MSSSSSNPEISISPSSSTTITSPSSTVSNKLFPSAILDTVYLYPSSSSSSSLLPSHVVHTRNRHARPFLLLWACFKSVELTLLLILYRSLSIWEAPAAALVVIALDSVNPWILALAIIYYTYNAAFTVLDRLVKTSVSLDTTSSTVFIIGTIMCACFFQWANIILLFATILKWMRLRMSPIALS